MTPKLLSYVGMTMVGLFLGSVPPILAQAPNEITWWTLVERVGFPGAIIIASGYGLWRVLRWTGVEIVKPIAASHMALVENLQTTNEANTETQKKTSEMLEQQVELLGEQRELTKKQLEGQERQEKAVDRLSDMVRAVSTELRNKGG